MYGNKRVNDMNYLRRTTPGLVLLTVVLYLVGCGSGSSSSNESGAVAPPTGLSATVLSGNQIQLAWTNVTSGLTSNQIYYSTNGTSFTLLNSAVGSSNSEVLTEADPGTTYYFYIMADNNGTTSAASATVSATTSGTTTGINVPSANGPAAPTGLTFSTVNPTTWKLSWTNAGTYANIILFASAKGTIYTQIDSITGTNTSIEFSGLVSGTTYYFEVQAQDSSGNYSNASASVTANP